MTDKPWLDVGTMAIARGRIRVCVPSLLDHLPDRASYRLRWICHLDQNGTGGMDKAWTEELKSIVDAADLFDDAVILADRTHVGYGGSFFRILREVKHGLLYADDDQLFMKDIRVTDAIDSGVDHYNWHNSGIGGTVPSYWSPRLVSYVLDNYPRNHLRITECALHLLAKRAVKFTSNYDPNLRGRHWPSRNSGSKGGLHYGPNRAFIAPDGTVQRPPHGADWLDFANELDGE